MKHVKKFLNDWDVEILLVIVYSAFIIGLGFEFT